MSSTKLSRIHSDLYNLLKEDSKTKKISITAASKEVADIYYTAKKLEKDLGLDLKTKKQKGHIVRFF